MSESEESLLDSVGTVMIAMKVALFLKEGHTSFTVKELKSRQLPFKNATLSYEAPNSFEIIITKEVDAGCLARNGDDLVVTEKGMQYYMQANQVIEENLRRAQKI